MDDINYDVVVVGAGISGITTAIRLKQLALEHNTDISVAIFEKGSSVGANIVSGCVLDPISLNNLVPNWQELMVNNFTKVKRESLYYLTEKYKFSLPHLTRWDNKNNYIVSLSQLCNKLGEYAESLGVDIYPGFPIANITISDNRLVSVTTQVAGLDKNHQPKSNYQEGMQIKAKQFILAEGARGSITKQIIQEFALDKGQSPQTYGLGIKEVWQTTNSRYQAGLVEHYIGYPLNNNAYGGGFIYHMHNNLIAIGIVTALDYKNPYLSPFAEFQKFKSHQKIKNILAKAKCLEYGARVVVEGGIQALPQLSFAGGVIVGDSAGFLNVPKIKGVHNAIQSGILAAKSVFSELKTKSKLNYDEIVKSSWLYKDLYKVRNIRPAFRFGLYLGLLYAGLEYYIFRGYAPWTFRWQKKDNEYLLPKHKFKQIKYLPVDGMVTFDKPSSIHLSNIHHDDMQPCHLFLKDNTVPIAINLKIYDAPETKYCPAGVYEIVLINGKQQLQINSQNCIHCKACDIKDPMQNIIWMTPEAGSGPQYSQM